MGGIKDREAKKKANHVFSGGQGGGTKGPSIIDKRNQELPCPHCDKIFKQSGRLTDHIKTKHADVAAAPADADAPGPSTSGAVPPPAAAAAVKPAAAQMMTLGSKAGYYTSKSPSMMLAEMRAADKAPRARIKELEKPDGLWGAKAVLPHGKKAELDVVAFVPDELLCTDRDAAHEMGALAALHAIAGHRNLELILPKQFVEPWRRLGEVAAERSARREAAAARETAAAERAKQQRLRELRLRARTQDVVMSASNLQMVEELIAEALREQASWRDEDGDGAAAAVPAADFDRLTALGFNAEQVQEAADAVGGAAGSDALLDWLCVHLEASQLPQRLRGKQALTVSVVRAGGAPAAGDLQPNSASPHVRRLAAFGYAADDAIAAVMQSESAASGAAGEGGTSESVGGDGPLLTAWRVLFERLTGSDAAACGPPEGMPGAASAIAAQVWLEGDGEAPTAADDDGDWDRDEDEQAWADEQVVLESIYGDAVVMQRTRHCVRMRLPLDNSLVRRFDPSNGSGAPAEAPSVDVVAVWWRGCGYPGALPLFGLTSRQLPPPLLLELTHRAARHLCDGCLGAPMLHELHDFLSQQLEGGGLPAAGTAARRFAGLMLRGPGRTESRGSLGVESASTASDGGPGTKRPARRGRQRTQVLSSEEMEAESRELQAMLARNRTSKDTAAMRAARQRLPAFGDREKVIEAVARHRVTVIAGATGCGKSTQVPQFILEDEIDRGRGGAANIVCTQPRRLPAVALANRVSDETATPCGSVVGFSVRLQKAVSRRTRLLFCTTGVLLRRLTSDRELSELTHVVVDEVHERSLDSDLLLLILRDVLAQHPRLRVVLMSATADAGLFARYFDEALAAPTALSVPGVSNEACVVEIPGFTYPVREFTLEDAFEWTGVTVDLGSACAKRSSAKENEEYEAALRERGLTTPDGQPYGRRTLRSLAAVDEAAINYELLAEVVAFVVRQEKRHGPLALLQGWPGLADAPDMGRTTLPGSGAILVFLPGMYEISTLAAKLKESRALDDALAGDAAWILPLHGGLPPAEQQEVFKPCGKGRRKIVLATNVAETSVTIEDVTVVVDTGRMKETQFDASRGLARLVEAWVSQAAARQRRGRAGRVRPGVCFRLYSRRQWDRLAAHQAPEMLRSPLEALVLQVKASLGAEEPIADVLARALTPPAPATVTGARALLVRRQALDEREALTPLGRYLTRMPLEPAVGKMLIYGAILQCVDPILTIAAAVAYGRSVFLSPAAARDEARAARSSIVGDNQAFNSDHLAVVFAYNTWRAARGRGGPRAARDWARGAFVSTEAMESIHLGRGEYAQTLAELGFVSNEYARRASRGGDVDYDEAPDAQAKNARFVKAAICAGFYPQVLRADNPAPKFVKVAGGAIEVDDARRVAASEASTSGERTQPDRAKLFDREKGRVFVHPASVNFSASKFQSGWLVYTEVVETSKVFVRECSMVPVYAMLIFGGSLRVEHEQRLVVVDDWARFEAPAKVGVLVRELRGLVAALLGHKLSHPALDITGEPVVQAMQSLLSTDGF